jgi:hypothetical protein
MERIQAVSRQMSFMGSRMCGGESRRMKCGVDFVGRTRIWGVGLVSDSRTTPQTPNIERRMRRLIS